MIDGEVLLIDCGERATVNLTKADINPIEVDHLFITHLHWDHFADYNYFLMTTWNCGKENTLHVYGPPGTREMHDSMLQANCGCGVCESVCGKLASADWGFRIESDYGSVAFSGDTVPCQAMVELAKDVDLLVHEATFLDEIIAQRAPAWTGHSGPTDAGRTAQEAGAKKLVLTHFGPYDSAPKAIEMASMYYGPRRGPQIWSKIISDAAAQYNGPIVIGEDAMRFRIGE